MQFPDPLFSLIVIGVLAFIAFRVWKFGGFRGALYGSRVLRTIGEIDLGQRAGATTTLRVHQLENGNIVVEQSSRAMLGASMQGFPLSRDNTIKLIALLKEAANA